MRPDCTRPWHDVAVNATWVDTHTHLDRYDEAERSAILGRARESGVAMVTVGVDIESSRHALAIEGTAGAVVGAHPLHAAGVDLHALASLLAQPGVVAIGECGFDAAGPPFEVQAGAFKAQARAARALRLPLVLHVDGEGAFDMLAAHAAELDGVGVIRHYFTGSELEATWHAERGHYLSFGNPLRREPVLREVALGYPAERIVIETDSYPLANRRTEPRDVARVGESLALVRGWTFGEASARLLENTRRALPRLRV